MTTKTEKHIRMVLLDLLFDPSIKNVDFDIVEDCIAIHLNVGESDRDITIIYRFSPDDFLEVMNTIIMERLKNGQK